MATAASLVLVGCPSPEHLLAVDLRTDFNPRAEFDAVEVTLDGVPARSLASDPETDYVNGVRVIEIPGLAPGSYRIGVALLRGGQLVAERPMVVDLNADRVFTALIPRSCAGLDCPEACQARRCVPYECTPETPSFCEGEPECTTPADCTDGAACSERVCSAGSCLYGERMSACMPDEFCEPETGCVSVSPPPPPPPCGRCLDPSFGVGGQASVAFDLGAPWTDTGVTVAADGRLYVVGRSGTVADPDLAVARLTPDGVLDATFGDAGIASIDVSPSDEAHAVVELADGGVIVCGNADQMGVVAKLRADGSLETEFGAAGWVTADHAPDLDLFNGCGQLSDGTILASGQASYGPGRGFDLQTVAFDARGAPRLSFGAGGVVADDFGGADEFGTGRLLSGDRWLAYGSSWQGPVAFDCLVVVYDAAGVPDPGFGTGGAALLDVGGVTNRCGAFVETSDGGLLGGGYVDEGGQEDALIHRLDASGAPVATFGTAGFVRVDLGCDDQSRGAVELSDGSVAAIVTGCPSGGSSEGVVLFLSATGAETERLVLPGTVSADGIALDDDGRLLVFSEGGAGETIVSRINP